MRRGLLRILRATHLIQIADQFVAARAVHKNARANDIYRAAHPERRFPDPALVFEVAGHAHLQAFDESGARDAARIASLLPNAQHARRVLDWGCGPGRVLAHMRTLLPQAEFNGCDPDPRALASASASLPEISFTRIGPAPPTPFAPASFDAIYGVSILTHLPEQRARVWIAELARLLDPDGAVLVTTHGARTAERLPPELQARFDAGDYVIRGGAKIGSRTYVSYFNEAAGRALFSPWFGDIAFHPGNAEFIQDIWVLRAPRRPSA